MRYKKGLAKTVVGIVVCLLVGLACNFGRLRPATPTPTGPDVEEIERIPVVTVVPGTETGEPPADGSSPVSGSIELEDGRCCAGGTAGETIQIAAAFSASSSDGRVTDMRFSTAGSGCSLAPSLTAAEWGPFAAQKEFPFQVVINWVGFDVWVQYRDDQGQVSSIYCDDISIEGAPAPPPGS